MRYDQRIILKNGKEARLRNGSAADGEAACKNYNTTHAETDYLLTYPDENPLGPEQEAQFLEERAKSPNEAEIRALVDGKIVGMAGVGAVGTKDKIRHRAELRIYILKEYWGLGIGKALAKACIQCAQEAGYVQLELCTVSENERAIMLYRDLGFVEFGHNPKGFNSRTGGFQELVYMLLEL